MPPLQPRLDPQGYYARLGVEPSAAPEEIVAAFRRKARVLHPDVADTGNTEAFVAVKLAYEVLSNAKRREAYDRSARLPPSAAAPSAEELEEPGEIPTPPPPRMPPMPVRQPRLSDLPFVVWAGMALALGVGVVEVALHLTATPPPTPHTTIRPNAPVVAPATPAMTRALAYGPTPLRLAGTPNYYVLPAASATVLWRHDGQRDAFVPAGELPPFSMVQALQLYRQNGMVEVKVTNEATGFIQAVRLQPGDALAAHQAYCAYNAGPTPGNGELLTQRSNGPVHLPLDNRTTQPAVVKLRDGSGRVAVSVFLAPGGHADVAGLPDERLQAEFAVGELWSRACNGFAAGMRAQRLPGFVQLGGLTGLAVPPEPGAQPAPVDISDEAFDQQ